jgi:signal transduction histidine kinase
MARRLPCAAAAVLLLLAVTALGGGSPALAYERVFRLLDQREGLPAGEVVRLAQDSRGFIWMGSFAGLVRYDGEQMRPWAPERLSGHVSVLITGPGGEVLVRVEPGRRGDVDPTTLYRIVPDGVEPVAGPDGAPLAGVTDAAFGSDGQLCATQETGVLCRLAGGAWVRHTLEDSATERPRWLRIGPRATVLAVTDAGLWQLDGSGGKRKIAAVPHIADVVPHPDGSLYATTFDTGSTGRIQRIAAGTAATVLTLRARPIDLAVRGHVVWASFDRFVVAVRPDEPPEVIGPEEGLPSGGPLLVDHEGSLWLGTYSGVMHLPEPETVVWTERDGLPSRHARFLEIIGDTMWVGSWQGLGQLRFRGGRWEARPGSAPGVDGMCLDAGGRLWMANAGAGFVRHEPDRRVLYPIPRLSSWLGCSPRSDGTLWLSSSQGLFVTSHRDGPPSRVASIPDDPPGDVYFRRIRQDGRDRLWVAANEQICQAPSAAVLSGNPRWQCRQIAGSRGISSIVELTDGDLWIATDRAGIWRFDEEDQDWTQLAGSTSLPSYSIRGLVPSGDGGVWILGHGTVARVRDDHDTADGWMVVERLTVMQGLPSGAAEAIVEQPNGSLWITTIVGLVHVPARARQSVLRPPAVELVDAVINGRRTTTDPAAWRLETADTVELRFAALSHRDRGLLRHEYRMGPDADWTDAPAGSGVFRFPDLAVGSHTVEVRASLDGRSWTAHPARVSFEILPPWYRRGWALAVFALTAASALYLAHRLRLAFLLRLERQRTRIAMDLHDEIGSGLASINILAGLAADRAPHGSQAGIVNKISETAADLGASLGEIVWSLRSRSATLDALVAHLADRAVKLFPPGTASFTMAIPDALPTVTLSLSVRWNVALIALEALHNAARHAGAAHVVLGLEPQDRRWRFWVEDDGRGLGAGGVRGSGLGIENMKRRATEIGGDLVMAPNDAGGLTVTLVFDPQAGPIEA